MDFTLADYRDAWREATDEMMALGLAATVDEVSYRAAVNKATRARLAYEAAAQREAEAKQAIYTFIPDYLS